jgi:hypothetical protein
MKMKRAINLYLDEEVIGAGKKLADYWSSSFSEHITQLILEELSVMKEAGCVTITEKEFNRAVTTNDKEKK